MNQKANTNLSSDAPGTRTYSVSELNHKVKSLLETHFPLIWIEGELSNLSQPSSGHWYFTLKDEGAQVRCAMFRGRNNLVRFKPKSGDHIRLRARVSLYEGRGDYQLIGEHMEDAGFGLLQRRFEELKDKLKAEGLFDDGFKKPIPLFPKHIGVVTSSSAAALRDVLHVLKRRCPGIPVTIFPSMVQGEKAPDDLIAAIKHAHTFGPDSKRCDVLILCRGGGSIEDLWAFNSEQLARFIFAAEIPIISAVGHEIDFTISDFVADVRAPTPSAAAEIVSPNLTEQLSALKQIEDQLARTISQIIRDSVNRFSLVKAQLRHPGDMINQWYQRLDQIQYRLENNLSHTFLGIEKRMSMVQSRLISSSPSNRIDRLSEDVDRVKKRLEKGTISHLEKLRAHFENLASTLDVVSPLATLKRGYTIVKNDSGDVLKTREQAKHHKQLNVLFSDGGLNVQVGKKNETIKK